MPTKRPVKDASWLQHCLAGSHIDVKALKMALYGLLVSAPIGHVLIGALQKAFAGKTGTGAKIAQILASNLLVAPVQTAGTQFISKYHYSAYLTTAYLASMAIINGAKSLDDVIKTVKAGFFSVIRARLVLPVI